MEYSPLFTSRSLGHAACTVPTRCGTQTHGSISHIFSSSPLSISKGQSKFNYRYQYPNYRYIDRYLPSVRASHYLSSDPSPAQVPRDLGRVTSKTRKLEISKITISTYYFKPKPTTEVHTHDDDDDNGRFSFVFLSKLGVSSSFHPPRDSETPSPRGPYLFQLLFESRR